MIARPGQHFPGLTVVNSGPWCGGSDEEWSAAMEQEYFVTVPRGGPIFYSYDPDGIQLEQPCNDDEFLTADEEICDLKINQEWAIIFQYLNRSESENQ